MSYPNAFCVKCGKTTDTNQKHTVLLQNGARALKGVCHACESEVYKILPKGKAFLPKAPLTAAEQQAYPDAFCVKCQEHTPTTNAHTVLFENRSRAVTGACRKCGSEVYRILPRATATAQAPTAPTAPRLPARFTAGSQGTARQAPAPIIWRADEAKKIGYWTYLAAAGLVLGVVAAFLARAIL